MTNDRAEQRTGTGAVLRGVCGAVALSMACSNAADAAAFRLGVAAVKITPPLGTPMAGYYGARGVEGVLDDLYAKATVLDDGRTQAALVVCDLIQVPQAVVSEARRLIAQQTAIPAEQVMISATHTHTGPAVLSGSAIEDLVTGGSPLSQEYTQKLPALIAQAVEQAHGRLTAARVFWGQEKESGSSFIRRYWMRDGSVGWNPGKLNPQIVRPVGTIDPQVNVIYAETASAQPAAVADRMASDGSHHTAKTNIQPLLTYVNFANHLDTTGGLLVSADFPATLARRLADYKGAEMLTIFGNGTCGNINHLDVQSSTPQTSPEEARRLGTILSGAVLKTYLRLTPATDTTLRVRRDVVSLPPAKFTDDELRTAREIVARKGKGASFLEQVKAYRVVDVAARAGKPYEVEVQVVTLGRDIAWVALPGEVFVELGLSIKAASPFRVTSVIELANGASSYIPHRSAFAEGNYEVISTRYAEGAGELLVTTAMGLLAKLHAE